MLLNEGEKGRSCADSKPGGTTFGATLGPKGRPKYKYVLLYLVYSIKVYSKLFRDCFRVPIKKKVADEPGAEAG